VRCQNNNLYLKVSKIKELIVDHRKRGAAVELVEGFMFLVSKSLRT
jgi:hypothetical protein